MRLLKSWSKGQRLIKVELQENERNHPWSAAEGSTTPACGGHPRCRKSDFFQALGHTHLLQHEMGCSHRIHMCKICFQIALPQSYEESMLEHGRLGLLLHDRHTSSFGICVPCVAFQSHKEAQYNQLESHQVRAL